MATIGNSLAPYFTATTSDVFSANGTGTDFTLTRSISNLVDIEVLVNNIQQNPFNGAYSVNGNTLTFSEAPSAGANNVLVSYRQAVIGSSIPTPNTVASSSLQRDLTLGGNTTSNGTMFTQALVPTANVTYDIGTSTLRYKDIYLSGSTINLGDVSLSASGNTFTVANSTGGTLPSSMGNTTIAGTANVTGDMTIGGNLTVTGTMTYINTTDLNIGDAIISLNADLAANIAPTEDAGININRGASTNAQFKWIESTDNWSLGNTTVSGILTSNDHVITGTANVSTGINVGANVNLSTSQINVGNSTVNTVISATALTTTSNTVTLGTAAYVTANGNVGIGTSSPARKLQAQTTGADSEILVTTVTSGNPRFGMDASGAYYNWIQTDRTSGAIQFAISNSERMRIDSSGNMGLAVTPSDWNANFKAFQISTGGSLSAAVSQSSLVDLGGNFYQDSAGAERYIASSSANKYRQYAGAHSWYTATSGTAGANVSFTQAMTLDASGNLGIGTGEPTFKLDVVTGTEATGQVALANFRTGSTTASYNAGLQIYASGSATAGNRGVIAVWDADGANAGGGDYFIINKAGNSGAIDLWQYSNASMRFATNYTSRATVDMTLDASGNLMIGGTTASGKLTVDPGSTSGTRIDGLHLPKNLTAQANYVAWQQGIAGWRAGIVYNDSTYPLAFYYGASTPTASAPGTELMRINTSGDLTITGSLRSFASPAFSLAANQFTDIMYIGAGGYGAIMSGILTVYSTYSGAVTQNSYFVNVIGHGGGTGISMLSQGNYSTPATTIVYDRSQVLGGGSRVIAVYNATGTNIAMSYSFSPVGSNNSAAYYSVLYNTGTAGAGTGIPSGDAVYFGQNYATVKAANIIFPSSQSASSDANTLDDYEESTWTPAITGCTVTVARSSVTKIGRLVTVSATITLASVSGSSNIQITNLPYPGTNGEFTGGVMLSTIAYTGDPVIYCYPPNQFFEIYLSTSNGNWTTLNNSNLSVNDAIIFSITYIST